MTTVETREKVVRGMGTKKEKKQPHGEHLPSKRGK